MDDIEQQHSKLRWYVIHAYSGFEKRVKKLLEEQIELKQLQHRFGRILVPSEDVFELRNGKKRQSERRFFPGYVLIEMENDENREAWHLIRRTPKVIGFIGGTVDNPSPISEKEANDILMRIHDSTSDIKPKQVFQVGEVVRVIDGPFADFNGTIEAVNYPKNRVQVSVGIFGRTTPVELEFHQVNKS